jgi:HEAT repeat protein
MNSLKRRRPFFPIVLVALVLTTAGFAIGQDGASSPRKELIMRSVQLQILQAEDERRWDESLSKLLSDPNAAVRVRAALAAGRIGNDQAVTALSSLLKDDKDRRVRAMAAFAIGEIESINGADPLISVIKNSAEAPEVRRRAIEGIGKIAAALPREQEARTRELGAIILDSLRVEGERSPSDSETILLALTAALRSRPPNAGPVIAGFLRHADSRVRADAANVLARLRLKDANNDLALLLTKDLDPIVRANAARVLGATEEKSASTTLLDRALNDSDSRVRVSAIRALPTVKDPNTAGPLLKRAATLLGEQRKQQTTGTKNPPVQNELLELTATLGRLLPLQTGNKTDERIVHAFFLNLRELVQPYAPENETAYVRALPGAYFSTYGRTEFPQGARRPQLLHWRSAASMATAVREVASLPNTVANNSELKTKAVLLLRDLLDNNSGDLTVMKNFHPEYAIPEILQALAAFKPNDLGDVALKYLAHEDVVVRSTAADLIGDLPPSDANTRALVTALAQTKGDPLNDAALSILDSLGKQKTSTANEAIKGALKSEDPLIRRRAVALLKTNGVGDFSTSIGTVKTSNTRLDYIRALSRSGRSVQAVVTTSKGSFTIDFLPSEAPLTVDNFVRLAQRVLPRHNHSSRSPKLCNSGRRSTRRREWRTWLSDSL